MSATFVRCQRQSWAIAVLTAANIVVPTANPVLTADDTAFTAAGQVPHAFARRFSL
jgi:hypothetical protein